MTIIVAYRRTPFGRFLGSLSGLAASDIGATALKSALNDAGLDPGEVDICVAGQVLQAGAGQNPARQTAVSAGIPLHVPAITLNAVCLSGMEAITYGHRLIQNGEASIVVCIGQESMSNAPHLLRHSRTGTKYGSAEIVDSLEFDGLTDAFGHCSMGFSTDSGNLERGWERDAQDRWAALSHQRAANSSEFFQGELAEVEVKSRKETAVFREDEGIRSDTTVETLGSLRPAFSSTGTITAGNASQISDGAACVVLMNEEAAESRGVRGLARIVSHAFVAGPDTQLHSQPSSAIVAALKKIGRPVSELRAVEINEAFASVVLQSTADLGVDSSIVNRHGGGIALGHPIGASGARIVGTLARELGVQGKGELGAAGICGGGGQGSALVIESL